MFNKIAVSLFVMFCGAALACATFDNLTVDQKVAVICKNTENIVKPECLRTVRSCVSSYEICVEGAASNAGLEDCENSFEACKSSSSKFVACNEAIHGLSLGCEAAIRKDAGNVCEVIAAEKDNVCSHFSDPLNRSSCERAFATADSACILSTASRNTEE